MAALSARRTALKRSGTMSQFELITVSYSARSSLFPVPVSPRLLRGHGTRLTQRLSTERPPPVHLQNHVRPDTPALVQSQQLDSVVLGQDVLAARQGDAHASSVH